MSKRSILCRIAGALALAIYAFCAQAQFSPGQLLTAAALNSQFFQYAPLTGATFTGPITLAYSGAALNLNDTSGSGFAQLNFNKSGSQYWAWANNSSSNTISLNRFNAGVFTDSPISVSPSTGLVTIADGATFNGLATFANGSAAISGAASINRVLAYQTNGSPRWWVQTSNEGETGGNAGTNYLICRASDSGSYIDCPVDVVRSTGNVTFVDGITAYGTNSIAGYAPLASPAFTSTPTAPTASTGNSTTQLATTQFVNNEISSGLVAGSFTTVAASGLITPTSAVGIKGTTTNDSAQAGSIGEYGTVATTSTSISSATATNITSVSLAAGDYDVSGDICFNPAASTVTTQVIAAINTTSATVPAAPDLTSINATFSTGAGACIATPVTRESLSTTTTVYLVGQTVFSASTMQTVARIRWRRIR